MAGLLATPHAMNGSWSKTTHLDGSESFTLLEHADARSWVGDIVPRVLYGENVNPNTLYKDDPDAFAREIAKAADWGEKPIGKLRLMGHSNDKSVFLGDKGGLNTFGVERLWGAAFSKKMRPDYEDARDGKLSPICWFRNDAKVELFGCNTAYAASESWRSILRHNANVYGATAYILGWRAPVSDSLNTPGPAMMGITNNTNPSGFPFAGATTEADFKEKFGAGNTAAKGADMYWKEAAGALE